MRRIRLLRNLLLLFALIVFFAPGCASDGPLAEGDRALSRGDAAGAERHYEAARAQGADPALVEERLRRAAVVARRERMHVAGAEALAEHGDYAAACAEYERALAIDPNDAPTRLALATALMKTARHDEARPHLDELAGDEACSADAATLLARFHYARGDYLEAMKHLRLALRIAPAHAAAGRALARMEKEWAGALARRDAQARESFEAGVRALYTKSYERAFESLTASLSEAEPASVGSIAPETVAEKVEEGYGRAALYGNLALACLRTDRPEEALGYLSLLDDLLPGSPHIAARIARVYESRELWAEAALRYEEAARRGGVPGLRPALAFALKKAGRYEESMQAFRAACLDEPENPFLRYNLAVMLKKTGDRAAARAELLRAKELAEPGTAFAWTVEEHLLALDRDDPAARATREM